MKKIVFKSVFVAIVVIISRIVSTTISPLITNYYAMLQMGISTDSSLWLQLYLSLKSYSWILWSFFLALMFGTEIKQLCVKVKNNIKDIE